jgi:hypothetical protein
VGDRVTLQGSVDRARYDVGSGGKGSRLHVRRRFLKLAWFASLWPHNAYSFPLSLDTVATPRH